MGALLAVNDTDIPSWRAMVGGLLKRRGRRRVVLRWHTKNVGTPMRPWSGRCSATPIPGTGSQSQAALRDGNCRDGEGSPNGSGQREEAMN